jgi:integrase
MNAQPNTRKSSKGSVQIKVSNNRLQLVFSYAGKRHYLSLGLEDNKLNRKAAEAKAKTIESDIAYDRFDPTLAKYKPQLALSVNTPTPIVTPNLSVLWEKYEESKESSVSPSTYAVDYRRHRNHIAKLPSKSLDDAIAIRDFLIKRYSPNTVRRVLTYLNACCDWALKSKLIGSNPFDGMAAEIQLPKSEKGEELDINPFDKEERDAIIKAFEESKLYSYYAPYVKFLFFTGCRPSEAVALQWKHIGDRFITFEQATIPSKNGRKIKQGLKTQKSRKLPINEQLKEILDNARTENAKPNDRVFSSKGGMPTDPGNFLRRAWKGYKNRHGHQIDGIVTQLVEEGLVSEYRKPYQCRHTFITLCLESGIDVKDVARWVGNSPEVIYKHYAGNKRDLQVPEL